MTIWNPLVFTPFGQPVGAVAPPTLRVYGGQASAAQVAMAQTAFQNFTAQARLSAAPNPTGIGALPDGSRFRIFVVGNQTIMEIWPMGGPSEGASLFSGILFRAHNIVLVNEGTVDAAGGKWKIRDVTSIPTTTGYFDAFSNQSLAPYSLSAIVAPSTILPAPMKYIYRSTEMVARYGQNYVSFIWPIGVTAARDKLISLVYAVGGSQAWSIAYSFPVDVEALFRDFGAPLISPPNVELDYDSAVEMIAQTSGDPQITITGPYIRKDGAQVLFRRQANSNRYTAADAGSYFNLRRVDRTTAVRNTSTGAILVPNAIVRMSFRDVNTDAVQFNRSGDAFGGPTVVHTVPQDDISAEGLYFGTWNSAQSAIETSDDVGVHLDYKTAPERVITDEYTDNTESEDPVHRGSEAIAGPITGRFSRIERTYDCVPHFVGGRLVVLPRAKVTSHESECDGSVNYSYLDGYFDFESTHDGPHQPGELADPREVHLLSSQGLSSSLHIEEYYTLNNGSRFYLVKYSYTETGSVDSEEHYLNNVIGEPAQRYGQDAKDMQYTVQREQRDLMVYDPALDLLCYTECLFQDTRGFSQLFIWQSEPTTSSTYTNSGGGGIPAVPTPHLVIKCRGQEIRLALPFNTANFNLASLLPATGISPYASPNGDLLTTQGFPGWEILVSASLPQFLKADAFLLDGEARSGDYNISQVRGHAPRIVLPTPTVEYVKTPVTGGAYLRATLTVAAVLVLDKTYLVDSTGIRAVEAVLPSFDVDNEKGVPF